MVEWWIVCVLSWIYWTIEALNLYFVYSIEQKKGLRSCRLILINWKNFHRRKRIKSIYFTSSCKFIRFIKIFRNFMELSLGKCFGKLSCKMEIFYSHHLLQKFIDRIKWMIFELEYHMWNHLRIYFFRICTEHKQKALTIIGRAQVDYEINVNISGKSWNFPLLFWYFLSNLSEELHLWMMEFFELNLITYEESIFWSKWMGKVESFSVSMMDQHVADEHSLNPICNPFLSNLFYKLFTSSLINFEQSYFPLHNLRLFNNWKI